MPPDGAVMVNAVDIFKSRRAGRASRRSSTACRFRRRSTRSSASPTRRSWTSTRSSRPTEPAQQWEAQWPTVQRKLRTNPLVVLSGFSTLVTRAQLTREGRTVHFHLAVSHDETLRLLAMASHMLGG